MVRIARPCRRAARQHQPVAADDAVVIVGVIAVADAAAITDRLRERLAKRRRRDHVSRHRHQRRSDPRHQFAERHIAAQDDVVGTQPRARRDDAFAHPARIDRQSGRVLENARAVALGGSGELERIVQRVDRERARVVDGVIVTLAAQCAAHAVGLPGLDLAAQFAEQLDFADKFVVVVSFGDMKPAVLRIDAGCAVGANGITHIIEAGLRQRPKILGAFEADPRNELIGVGAKAWQHETGIAPRRVAGETAGLQHHDGPAVARHFPRRGQAREPAADDADIDVKIERQLRARRRFEFRRGVPTIAVGRCEDCRRSSGGSQVFRECCCGL